MPKVRDDEDVEERLKELEEELERESAAAQRALEAEEAEAAAEAATEDDLDEDEDLDEEPEEEPPPKKRAKKKKKKKKKKRRKKPKLETLKEDLHEGAREVVGEIAAESMRTGEGVGKTALAVVGDRLPEVSEGSWKQTGLTIAGVGLAGLIAWKVVAPIVLGPIMMLLSILGFGLKVGLVGGGLYGGYKIYKWASEDDELSEDDEDED